MAVSGRGVLGATVVLSSLALALVSLLYPQTPLGMACWSVEVLAVLWGLGGAARRAVEIEVGPGEQMVLGMVVWLFGSGLLLAIGHASRVPLLIFAFAGLGFAAFEVITRPRGAASPRTDDRVLRLVLGCLVGAYLAINLLGAAQTRGNPYDDQIAYTAFVKRLLDCGDLIEPFSFRRLSAYGGQTVLQALAALRGDASSFDLLDRGIFEVVAVLLVVDMARRRRLHLQTTVLLVGFTLSLWDLRINSAATWTGFVAFLGAYSFASREDISPRRSLILTCATCAAACTLRQNYLVPGAMMAALILGFHLRAAVRAASWSTAWRAERATIGLAIGAAAAVLLPYMIATLVAAGTALYPLMLGTGNPITPLRPTASTWYDEAQFFISVVFNPEPIRIWWLIAPLMVIARDRRERRPWPALLIGCGIGFAFLIHSFMLSDSFNLWRYAFAYMTALAVAFALEIFGRLPLIESEIEPRLKLSTAATVLALCAVMVNFVAARGAIADIFKTTVQNLHALGKINDANNAPRAAGYERLQGAVPEGATIAVMVDDPWMLDYGRNRIFNLDLPGFAAPAPGLPSFTDPAHWRAYFAARGIRYLAFAEDNRSVYLYRRAAWIWRMFGDDEIFRFMGAHIIDIIDTFMQLARDSRVLFHRDGLYVLDLGAEVGPQTERGEPELVRMDRFIRRFSETELHNKAWQLAPRADVVFTQDGFGPSSVVPFPSPEPESALAAWLKQNMDVGDLPAHRWLMDRTHLRLKANGHAHGHLKVWLRPVRAFTTPSVSFIVEGQLVGTAMPDRDGYVAIDGEARCTGWCDGYILLSTISEWWAAPDALQIAKLLEFEWNETR